jgi:hypothetical protein
MTAWDVACFAVAVLTGFTGGFGLGVAMTKRSGSRDG